LLKQGAKNSDLTCIIHTNILKVLKFWLEDPYIVGKPGLQNELQDSQGYTEKHCLKNKQTNKQNKKQKTNSYIAECAALTRFIHGDIEMGTAVPAP
jgi:proline dehydrogenase